MASASAGREEWKAKMLAESKRLRENLAEAKKKRESARLEAIKHQEEAEQESSLSSQSSMELAELEEMQQKLSDRSSRFLQLVTDVEDTKKAEGLTSAQLQKLTLAEKVMNETNERMLELEQEAEEDGDDFDDDDLDDLDDEAGDNNSRPGNIPHLNKIHSESFMANAEDAWGRMVGESSIYEDETARVQPRKTSEELAKDGDFAVPPKPQRRDEYQSFDEMVTDMQLTSSPLIFFNLACFQGSYQGDIEVMHPICGYATAGSLISIMGPEGTDTTTLRIALAGMPKENKQDVLVTDFTVAGLMHVAEDHARTPGMDPSQSLLDIHGLGAVANEKIGTCIQRGAKADDPTIGTPRGSRTPEAPTPRNLAARKFPDSEVALHKSVLLMEDLSSILGAEDIFTILRVLKKLVRKERASALVTLIRPFERRGLHKIFDYSLVFSRDGVVYFGRQRAMRSFTHLIGAPCPAGTHLTDHLVGISHIEAKFAESGLKKHIDTVITRFTGMKTSEEDAPEAVQETPRTAANRKVSGSAFAPTRFMRRKSKKSFKKNQLPEAIEAGVAAVDAAGKKKESHARKLARRLAEERKRLAASQEASQKLEIWRNHASLDGLDDFMTTGATFEQILVEMQQKVQTTNPSCFMNLACFLEEGLRIQDTAAVQRTCAYASEGNVLGVVGSRGVDADNLLNSLKIGTEVTTLVTDLSVRDVVKINEFLQAKAAAGGNQEKEDALEASVEVLMAKMMLTASSQQVVGTLIQRTKATAPANMTLEIGDQTFSTASRSILVLDQYESLDAESLYVTLKLIRRIAKGARLAVVLMMEKPEQQEGLLCLTDNILLFHGEHLFYFGPTRHLRSYCDLVDFRCPPGADVLGHVRNIMESHSEEKPLDPANTSFIVRYNFSPLAKYHGRVISVATGPATDGGSTARTMLPRSSRSRRNSIKKGDDERWTIERNEIARQRAYAETFKGIQRKREEERQLLAYEAAWKGVIKAASGGREGGGYPGDSSSLSEDQQPIATRNDLKVVVEEMAANDTLPSLFFNLASFVPKAFRGRDDLLEPICGFATPGRVCALMGPPETELATFLGTLDGGSETLNTPRGRTTRRVASVDSVFKLLTEDAAGDGSAPTAMIPKALKAVRHVNVGHLIVRNKSEKEIHHHTLVIEDIVKLLLPQQAIELLRSIQALAKSTSITVIINCENAVSRRCMFAFTDDLLCFNDCGSSYFGPANRLAEYIRIMSIGGVAASSTASEQHPQQQPHPLDTLFDDMEKYRSLATRSPSDTSPAVRYRYSVMADYVANVATTFVGNQTTRGAKMFGKGNVNEKDLTPEQREALKRQRASDQDAEAERQRIAETDAEQMWSKLANKEEN